jgi:hypothetical protein
MACTSSAAPCPFCGSTNLVDGSWYVDDEEVAAIECDDCKAGAPASVWDRRANDTRPGAPVGALNSRNGSYRP